MQYKVNKSLGDFGLLFLFCIAVGRSLGLRAPAAWQSRGVFHNIISLLTRKTLRFYLDSSTFFVRHSTYLQQKSLTDTSIRLFSVGWKMGFEPTTPGTTIRCSTTELHPPFLIAMQRYKLIFNLQYFLGCFF